MVVWSVGGFAFGAMGVLEWLCLCGALGGCVVWGGFAFGGVWWSGMVVLGWSGLFCFGGRLVVWGGCVWVGRLVVLWSGVCVCVCVRFFFDGLVSQHWVPTIRHRTLDCIPS